MSQQINNDQPLRVAQALVAAARQANYIVDGDPMRSAPEIAELEKPLFVKMFQELRTHLQKSERMELSADEISSMFNFAVGKGAEQAYNYFSGQNQDCNVIGLFAPRISLYVDDRLMNFLKAEPIAPTLGKAYLDFQSENPDIDPILGLFEALKWAMRISVHLTLKLIESWQEQ